jgi:hypothetical protein
MSENKTTITAILDSVGRTIIGEVNQEKTNDQILGIKNPVVLHIVPQDQSGRMSVQLLPLFFREFLADKTGDVTFEYKKENVTEIYTDALDFRLQAQYSQLFNKSNVFVPPAAQPAAAQSNQPGNSVINLFDE